MTDILTKEQRSYNMSRIRSTETKTEVKLRRLLFAKGIRGYRKYYNLLGKPDIVFIKKKLVVFVDGCFWHKCPIDFVKPETRTDFWMKKIESNVKRDKEINEKLEHEGWTVLRFWEHDIMKNAEKVISDIIKILECC